MAPVRPNKSDADKPTVSLLGRNAAATSSATATPSRTLTQSGTSLAAEITDLSNLAPSTPWWRAACRAPLGWAGSLRAPAGGRGGSEVPTLEASPHELAFRAARIWPRLARSTTTSRARPTVRPLGIVRATTVYVPGASRSPPTRAGIRTRFTPRWPRTRKRPTRRQSGASSRTTNSTSACLRRMNTSFVRRWGPVREIQSRARRRRLTPLVPVPACRPPLVPPALWPEAPEPVPADPPPPWLPPPPLDPPPPPLPGGGADVPTEASRRDGYRCRRCRWQRRRRRHRGHGHRRGRHRRQCDGRQCDRRERDRRERDGREREQWRLDRAGRPTHPPISARPIRATGPPGAATSISIARKNGREPLGDTAEKIRASDRCLEAPFLAACYGVVSGGGEIRTHGRLAPQRFSRPPRSTAPAPRRTAILAPLTGSDPVKAYGVRPR